MNRAFRRIMWLLALLPLTAAAQEPGAREAPLKETSEQVIEPQLDRRQIKIPHIDAQDFEISWFTGKLSVEDFGASSVKGVRLAYHVTEDIFAEGTYGESTVSDTSFRRFGIAILNHQQERLTYYNLSLGLNLFPGEVFVGKNWAMTSGVYVIGGTGNTNFNKINNTTFNFGMGIRLLPTDWLAFRIEMRDHLFESDLLGKKKVTNNFELTAGLSVYF